MDSDVLHQQVLGVHRSPRRFVKLMRAMRRVVRMFIEDLFRFVFVIWQNRQAFHIQYYASDQPMTGSIRRVRLDPCERKALHRQHFLRRRKSKSCSLGWIYPEELIVNHVIAAEYDLFIQ